MELPKDAKDFIIKLEPYEIKLEPGESYKDSSGRFNEIKLEEIEIKGEPLGDTDGFKIEDNEILISPDYSCNAKEHNSLSHSCLADYLNGKDNFKIRVVYEEPESDEEYPETRTESSLSALTNTFHSVDDFIENNPQIFDETADYLENIDNNSNKPVYCQFCKKSYKEKGDLKRHIEASHFNIKPFHCNICNKDFTRKNSLKKHMNKFHGRDESLKCHICSFQAGSKYVLQRHLTGVHKKISSVVHCAYCNKSFRHKQYLINHMKRIHLSMFTIENKTAYEKKFNYQRNDKDPSQRKRSFQKCPHCQYFARDSTRIEGHINSKHRLVKPYHCNVCSYSAANKEYLRLHVLTSHSSNYQCNYCILSFKCKSSLKNHYYQCHSSRFFDEHFICHYCYEIYHCKTIFIKHLNMQHSFKFNK